MRLSALLLAAGFAVSCDSKLEVKTSQAELAGEIEPAGEAPEGDDPQSTMRSAKLDAADCVNPNLDNVPVSETLTLCDGTLAQGKLVILPESIKAGVTIAGVTGNYSDATPDCTSDGEMGCVVVGPAFKAAKLSNLLASDLRSGVTIAGVSGTGVLESHSNCSSDGETGCVTTAAYKAVDMAQVMAGNIKSGVTIAGQAGTYPSIATPLVGATATTDLTSLGATTAAGTYEFFDSAGVRYTGAISDAGTVTPGGGDQIFNSSLYRQFTVAGDNDLTVGNIKSGVNIFGVAGTLTGAPSNCTSNAQVGCVTTSTFKAADLSNLTAANIKKNVVLAGVTGDYPSVTNPLAGADGTTDLPGFASTAGGTTYEWFASDGTRVTGAIEADENVTPGTADQTFNTGLYRSVTVAGDADLTASNIKNAVAIFGVTGNVVPSAANCSSDGEVGCVTTASYKAADMTNVIPGNIKDTVVIAGVTGNLSGTPVNCSANGEMGCVTTSTYKAADLTNLLSGNVKNGVTIAGMAGTYPSLATPLAGATGTSDLTSMAANTPAGNYEFFDSIGTRHTGSITDAGTVTPGTSNQTFTTSLYRQFTVVGDADLAAGNISAGVQIFAVTGTVTPSPADCSADNQTGCVTTSTYKSADTSAFLASDLKSGKTVAGVAGSLANCSTDGGIGCVTTASYKAADMANVTAGNIKSGVTIAGQAGDYPSATNRLAGADATTDLPTFASTAGGTAYEWFQSDGTRLTAAVQANQTVTPSTSNQTLNAGLYRSVTVNGDADLVAGKIKSGIDLFGVAGGYPSATYPLTSADGTADLDNITFDAKIKSSSSFEWFSSDGTRYTNTGDTDITAANIASGVTIFGATGTIINSDCASDGQVGCITTAQYKSADTNAYTTWDIRKGKTVGGKAGDIVFYKNMADLPRFNRTTGTGANSSTSVADIYDTTDDFGFLYSGFPTLNPPGWDQMTGANWVMDSVNDNGAGGGTASNGLCEGSEACVFKDRITGLMWSKDNGTSYTWEDAITQCENLSYGGYTDWRLPTQKEALQASIDGIYSQRASDKLNTGLSPVHWSSTSYSATNGWNIGFHFGQVNYTTKTTTLKVLCVR